MQPCIKGMQAGGKPGQKSFNRNKRRMIKMKPEGMNTIKPGMPVIV